ncbi:helix-turn-helix transcriptional regulator [Geobacter sp. FeAm09]|uniref:helix-turn-helix domain-containing protein n=1 Tax=Geobacter sp. FeAm09 TaxID=2597769 RepID=UPI0011EDF7D4|nr:helix-turn-helix transcriptional regulator [Geobacter sp. FeAm09]QEM66721.1 helix-turn-helix transcriptional regulator [Geobacter sp. FeAm09]
MQNCIQAELRKIRLNIGFSIREMAADLNLHPATYQKYEDGSRTLPAEVLKMACELKQKVDEFMAGMPARIDARIEEDYPHGIPGRGGSDVQEIEKQ